MKIKIFVSLILSMVFSISVAGQTATDPPLLKNCPVENLQLNTNRDVYITGEKIWFTVWYSEKSSDEPLSKVLYLELINNENKAVIAKKYKIKDQTINGHLSIPDEIPTGVYYLRCYTNFMKNYPVESLPGMLIKIINPDYNFELIQTQKLDSFNILCRQFGEKKELALKIRPDIAENLKMILINADTGLTPLFMINQIQNTYWISFKNELPDNLVFITQDHDTIYKDIPPAKIEDIEIGYKINKNDIELEFLNNTPENYKMNIFSKEYIPIYATALDIQGNTKKLNVSKTDLGFGLNYIIIKDKDENIKSFRIIYNNKAGSNQLKIKNDQKDHGNNGLHQFTVYSETPLLANVIISLKNTEAKTNKISENIISNPFLLNTSFFDDKSQEKQIRAILMFYEESPKAKTIVSDIQKAEEKTVTYLPEIKNISISGKLVNPKNKKAVHDKLIYSSVIGEMPQIHIKRTDSDGNFYFNLNHLYNTQNVYLGFEDPDSMEYEILIHSDFLKKYPDFENLTPGLSPADSTYLVNLLINSSVNKSYYSDSVKTFTTELKKYNIFGTLPINTLLSDYIELNNLEEVFNEIIPYTKVRSFKGNKSFIVYDRELNYNYNKPLVLVDNIPVFNVNHVLEIPPSKIEEIGVINKTYLLGNNFLKGIIIIKTKTDNFGGATMPEGSSFFEYTTLSEQSLPVIDLLEKNRFLNMLYYQSGISIDNTGKKIDFRMPDNKLSYELNLNAKDKEGRIYQIRYPIK